MGYIDSDNRREAVSNIGDVRMIDACNSHHQRASVYYILRKQNRAVAIDWLCRYQVSIVSNQPGPGKSSVHYQCSCQHGIGMVGNVEDRQRSSLGNVEVYWVDGD